MTPLQVAKEMFNRGFGSLAIEAHIENEFGVGIDAPAVARQARGEIIKAREAGPSLARLMFKDGASFAQVRDALKASGLDSQDSINLAIAIRDELKIS